MALNFPDASNLLSQLSNYRVNPNQIDEALTILDDYSLVDIANSGGLDALYNELFGETAETRKEWYNGSDEIYEFAHLQLTEIAEKAKTSHQYDQLYEYGDIFDDEESLKIDCAIQILNNIRPL